MAKKVSTREASGPISRREAFVSHGALSARGQHQMSKEKLTPTDLDARLKFILGITLGSILLCTAIGILYGLLFVTQPIGAQSENDKMFFNVLGSIATFITGTLAGILIGNLVLKTLWQHSCLTKRWMPKIHRQIKN
jgi:hypothetical protein